ncbi:MAG: phosphoribosyltransferase family protein [Luteolibacter sp.]|nr:phosphoribosyltransferase family protein [Luteolibacter sp.]
MNPQSIQTPSSLPPQAIIPRRFGSRQEAGRVLAGRLKRFAGVSDVLVLALPKGGMCVAAEIACILDLPFDVLLINRIMTPSCGRTPLGAITSGGVRMLNGAMIDRLHLEDEEIHRAVLKKSLQLARREKLYRNQRPSLEIADRTVILVDDGSSPCADLRNAIRLLRRQHAEHVVIAMPTTCHRAACDLRLEADEVVTLAEYSAPVRAAKWFDDRPPTAAEVRQLLNR